MNSPDLVVAAQQALEALEKTIVLHDPMRVSAITALRAALAEYDKDRVRIEERKAKWAEQLKLARETQERDRQQREYEEQRLAALAEPVQEPVAWMTHGNDLLPLFHKTKAGALAWGSEPQPLYTAPTQQAEQTKSSEET